MPDVSPRLTAALSDRYRIEQELGAGGMAAVYLAEDLKRQRQVAIKALKPKLAAVLGAERFVERQIGEGGMTTELPSGRPPFTGGTP
jgi:serine/threonine-protein kinase